VVKFATRLSPELIRALKMKAASEGTTMQALVIEAIEKSLDPDAKRQKRARMALGQIIDHPHK